MLIGPTLKRARAQMFGIVLSAVWACSSQSGEPIGEIASRLPDPGDPPAPLALSTVTVPEPANLYDFVKDKQKAIVLGKALFGKCKLEATAFKLARRAISAPAPIRARAIR